MSPLSKQCRECTSIVVGGIGLHNSSIGGRFFTSSDLIPFSLRDFLASFITSSVNSIIPLFFGVGASSGIFQSSWFLLILANNSSASAGVLSLKTQPAQLSRYVLDSSVNPLWNISINTLLGKGHTITPLIKEQNLAHATGNISPFSCTKSKMFCKVAC